MLISVDLPAPLSPTSPKASLRRKSRLTLLSAWTPEYHLQVAHGDDRPVHLRPHLHRPAALAQPGIADA